MNGNGNPWPSKTPGVATIRVHRYFIGMLREVRCRTCDWPPGHERIGLDYEEMVRHAEAHPAHEISFHTVDACVMTAKPMMAPTAREFRTLANIESNTTCLLFASEELLTAIRENTGIMPDRVEVTEYGQVAFHESGPSVLEAIGQLMIAIPPEWDSLLPDEQRAVILCAARSNPGWHAEGRIDPDHAAALMDECP